MSPLSDLLRSTAATRGAALLRAATPSWLSAVLAAAGGTETAVAAALDAAVEWVAARYGGSAEEARAYVKRSVARTADSARGTAAATHLRQWLDTR